MAVLGVLYAVLLAFAIIVVCRNSVTPRPASCRRRARQRRFTGCPQGMGEKPGADIRAAITVLPGSGIADDWPAMDRGVPSAKRGRPQGASTRSTSTLLQSNIAQSSGNPVMSELLYQLDQMTQARREAYSRRGRRPRRHMARAVRRRCHYDRFHLLFRNAKPFARRS